MTADYRFMARRAIFDGQRDNKSVLHICTYLLGICSFLLYSYIGQVDSEALYRHAC